MGEQGLMSRGFWYATPINSLYYLHIHIRIDMVASWAQGIRCVFKNIKHCRTPPRSDRATTVTVHGVAAPSYKLRLLNEQGLMDPGPTDARPVPPAREKASTEGCRRCGCGHSRGVRIGARRCRSEVERFLFARVECNRSDWQSSSTCDGC